MKVAVNLSARAQRAMNRATTNPRAMIEQVVPNVQTS